MNDKDGPRVERPLIKRLKRYLLFNSLLVKGCLLIKETSLTKILEDRITGS